MHVLNHVWGLLLWMYLLTIVYAQDCTVENFKRRDYFDDNFDLSRLKQRYAKGDTVRVHCKVGFRGFFKLICTEDGWHKHGDNCSPVSCGHPGDVQFADFSLVSGDDYVFGSQVQYTCHRGYQMTSITSTRDCLQGGWDGHLPVCEPISCQPLTVSDNVMVNGDIDQPTTGSVLQFSCRDRSYILDGPAQIFCDESGQWSDKEPSCKIISCSEPPLNHFRITNKKDVYREGDVLNYICDENYTKRDGRPARCEKTGQSAQWVPTPQCEPITCKVSADPPSGTTYNPRDRLIFTPGESLTVTCGENKWVKSTELQTAQLVCKNTGRTGSWDFNPVCQPVKCLKDDSLVSRWEGGSYYSYHYRTSADIDEILWYQCRGGFEAVDRDSRARCTRRGWEPKPLCKERGCTKPSYKNAEITDYYQYDKYNTNDRVYFKCTYEPTRTFSVYCQSGTWKGSVAECKGQRCETPPTVKNGEMIDRSRRNPYEDGSSVWFRCNGDTDHFKVTCDSGQWKKDKSCENVPCSQPPNIRNAEMDTPPEQQYAHGQEVTLSCSTGLKETFQVSCQSGEWINNHQCEVPTACSGSDIPNGYSHEYNNTLYYTCLPEYKLLGKGWWDVASCENGKWNTQECVAKTDCGPVPDIPNVSVMSENQRFPNGFRIQIGCEAGYRPLLQELTCREGKWSDKTEEKVDFKSICTPIAKLCRPPTKVKDALIFAPFEKEYLSDTVLEYKCRDNYIMQGNGTIVCKNGKWQQESIRCNEPEVIETEVD